jgi:hypothetical protein|nr:hypothetical protein [uncultured bacterium]
MKKALIILAGLCVLMTLSCASSKGSDSSLFSDEEFKPETIWYFPEIEGTLGPMNIRNQDTQMGWGSDGTDNKDGQPIENFITAKFLVLHLADKPAGGLQIIWQGDSDGWNWNQNDGVLSDKGEPNAAKGASLSEDNVLTIDLSKALNKYSDYFVNNTKTKILLGYYSDDVAALGIKKADFLY